MLVGDDQVAQRVSGCQLDKKCVYLGHEIAFSEVGFHITVIVMDSPDGSVCRLTYSERVEFPTDPALCRKNKKRALIPSAIISPQDNIPSSSSSSSSTASTTSDNDNGTNQNSIKSSKKPRCS
ncbi:hypothetical protein BDC45DRAFT_566472 [Circinella umbellata]|nr:hypothetical protein BDC45DRAFT_566472 [Circinella umbellata]